MLVLSKLGIDQFDSDDLRFLEVLAGHASVAFANARLYEAERREAHGAKALLELSRELAACTELNAVAERVVRGAVRILDVPRASLWLPLDDDAGLACLSRWPDDEDPARAQPGDRLAPRAPPAAREQERAVPDPQRGSPSRRSARTSTGRSPPRTPWRRFRSKAATGDRPHAGPRAKHSTGGDSICLRVSPSGQARARQRVFLREPRARVPLDGRGARQRARGEGRVHRGARAPDRDGRRGRQELGLDAPTPQALELAALFHDIGKIGVGPRSSPSPGR